MRASGGRVAGGAGVRFRSGVALEVGSGVGAAEGRTLGVGRSLAGEVGAALESGVGVPVGLGAGLGDGMSVGVDSGDGVMRGTIVATMTGRCACGADVACVALGEVTTATTGPSSRCEKTFEISAPIARPPMTIKIASGMSGIQLVFFAGRGRRVGVRRDILPAVPAASA